MELMPYTIATALFSHLDPLIAAIDWAGKMQEWVDKHGPGIIAGALSGVLVLLVGFVLIRIIVAMLARVLRRRKVSTLLERFLLMITRRALGVVAIVVALSELGLDVAPLIAGLGIGGFILGFAFQETLGNLAAGLMLLINEPFKEGDWIEAAGTSGTVTDLTIMATTLATGDNKLVTVPNRKVWGDKIVNFNALKTRRVDMVFGVAYSSDIGTVIGVINAVVTAHPMVHKEPAPKIAVGELMDSSINLVVRPWCDTPNFWAVKFDLTRQIKEALDRENIEIPFPQMDLHVRDIANSRVA